ncbi:aldose epimerase family protein [Streptomyces sp. FH025]|uniref:aldose epimerase family protein n=1 Tax=Streptomyces sp. FH025 TaxID=2815937 RepID=UPI001A9D6B47|nr:aldose epimerase family protein [Streptomyces sp. FH025]MBO1413887.1 galactose mutarotase [Streptomyces sp. FH025]
MTADLTIRTHPAGELPDGRAIDRWVFGASDGVTAEVLSLGARLQSLHAPDRDGHRANVVLGGGSPAELIGEAAYLGSTVGRYGNRIAGGELPLDGTVHRLATQESGHTLHGGPDGFATRLWAGTPLEEGDRVGVRLELHSPDGDQGFPGALDVTVSYLLDRAGELTISYRAETDAPTVVNLTNHAYVNLGGEGSGPVLDHLLQVEADEYLPVDHDLIPLGAPEPVKETPFDLTTAAGLGGRLSAPHPQVRLAGDGFDHTWVLRPGAGLRPAATLHHPGSGRRLDCLTTEPGVQVYTGNHFDGTLTGPGGRPYGRYAGIALETQHFPDSPHFPEYPSTVLRPGERYESTTVYRFSVE